MEKKKQTRPQKHSNRIQKLEQNFEQQQRKRKSQDIHNTVPVVKKTKRKLVADSEKDKKYWDLRRKNNLAAKRSRDRRREVEIEVAVRWKELQQENAMLKEQLLKLKVKVAEVEKKLERFQ